MDISIYLHILIFLMIFGALIAIETSNLLSSVISVGAVGFILAIGFLMLGAPDIAITQVVVEVLSLVILIRATISRDLTDISERNEIFRIIMIVAVISVASVLSLKLFAYFPQFGVSVLDRIADAPSNRYLAEGLQKTGSANIVTSILLDFRAYDTLGEATVLFCSILGALAILRRKARKKIEEKDEDSDAA